MEESGDFCEGRGTEDGGVGREVRVGAEDAGGDEEGDLALHGHGDGGRGLAIIVCHTPHTRVKHTSGHVSDEQGE